MGKMPLKQMEKLVELEIASSIYCADVENTEYQGKLNSLPDNVYPCDANYIKFLKVNLKDFSETEINTIVNIDKAISLTTIKKCLLFLTTISAIGVAAAFIYVLTMIM